MRIQGSKLKKSAKEMGVSEEDLARAVDRTGLTGKRTLTAVRNWMRDNDHPRCKSSDIARLAQAMGVEPRTIARFTSEVKTHRGSTQKARLVADLIRGKSFKDADELLQFSPKRAATNVRKCLRAAYDEALQADADDEKLVVVESRVNEGPQIKRFRPKDRGRAHPIIKQTSHITVGLEERA